MTRDDMTLEAKPGRFPGAAVLLGGLATIAVALAAILVVAIISDGESMLLGYYVWYIVPVSAILVGIVAGSGFGIASYLTGAHVSRMVLVLVGLMMLWGYFLGQYIEFRYVEPVWVDEQGAETPMSFLEYYDYSTRNIVFEDTEETGDDTEQDEALGAWGYGVRALEIVGFSIGGLVPLVILGCQPYCESCGVYRKTKQLGWLPAAPPARKVKKKDADDVAAWEAEMQKAQAEAERVDEQLEELAEQGQADAWRSLLAEKGVAKPQVKKHPKLIRYDLVYCPKCRGGQIVRKIMTPNSQKNAWDTEEMDRRRVGEDFAAALAENQRPAKTTT